MNLVAIFNWLAEQVGEQYGIPGGPTKSDYPERRVESREGDDSKAVEKNLKAKPKTATPGLGAKLDKEFWETF